MLSKTNQSNTQVLNVCFRVTISFLIQTPGNEILKKSLFEAIKIICY